MDERQEVINLILAADEDTLQELMKLLKLSTSSPGFIAAFKAATPEGEEFPPNEVIKALVSEWIEKEGF